MSAETEESSGQIVDFHNHVIPGVDDGARDANDAREALAAMQADGVRALVATPHVDASIALREDRLNERMGEVDAGWTGLEGVLQDFPDLDVRRGAEVKLDLPDPDLTDPRFRLGASSFVLVEFPYFTVPPRSGRVMAHLRSRGWTPIVAHPERYGGMLSGVDVIEEWRAAGAYLQVNGPSLTGRYGEEPRQAAIRILERGWVDYLSSDYHARGRPGIVGYRETLLALGGEEQVTLLMETNPGRMLMNEAPLPVPPLSAKRGLWDRISDAFR